MRETDIKDPDIPGADPAAVVAQYEPLIKKIAERYISILDRSGAVGLDDLYQVGRIAVLKAQKDYVPGQGYSFFRCLDYAIRRYMRAAVGINPETGAAPAQLVYLDEPLPGTDGEEITRLDVLADPDAVPLDEPLIDEETRNETATAVRAAVDRMRSDKQRDIIKRVYLDGQTRQQAAEETGAKVTAVYALDREGRSTLRRDYRLRQYAMQMPSFSVSVTRFRQTFTSATEAAVLWREEHLPQQLRQPEPPKSIQDSIRDLWNREHTEPAR